MSRDVALEAISMRFGESVAVRDVSFTIEPGEFFSILGPSGCGKTTLLRIVAGFLDPTSGRVLIGGRDMAGLPPNRRPTAMIFQSLALFPLMSVRDNIAFGLEMRGLAKRERHARAEALLDLIALPGFGDRAIHELSGGQRQRVAIARALAVEPQVLLLDEPLSALDLKLRQHMRAELRAIQRRTGVTFLYITHDQSEAMAMSDRIAVMDRGVVQQIDPPRAIYEAPRTGFVARFVGETNAFSGTVVEAGDAPLLRTAAGDFRARAPEPAAAGETRTVFVRPEALRLARGDEAANAFEARLAGRDFEGAHAIVRATRSDGEQVAIQMPAAEADALPGPGAAVRLAFDPARAVALRDG